MKDLKPVQLLSMKSEVSIIKCTNYDSAKVFKAVESAVNLIGGIGSFVKPGAKVLVKPNILMATPPETGVTTHPEVVRAVLRLLKQLNCKVYVGDGPSVWGGYIENVDQVYAVSGIEGVCRQEGVEMVKFHKKHWRQNIPFTNWLDDCQYLINIPKVKTHSFTLMTGAIKNLFGLVPGTYKTELHKAYFQPNSFAEMLVDIYQRARPVLNIVDGITAIEGDGPGTSGKVRKLGVMLASTDAVAVDSVIAVLMGIEPSQVPTIVHADMRKLGVADINNIEILGESIKDVKQKPFLLPSSGAKAKIPRVVAEIAKKLIRYYPYVVNTKCIRCGACIKACPAKIVSIKNNRIVFNYSKCIACFCCQEVCPQAAIKIRRSIVAKLIGL